MTPPLRCGVVGAGVFGGHHARQYARLAGASLAAVYDPHGDHAKSLAQACGAEAFTEFGPFLEAVDAVSICSPATAHADAALKALKRRIPVYVEKPMAVTMQEADALMEAASRAGVALAVGHQERMVFQAMGLFDAPERPILLHAVRKSPYTGRSADVSCVLDIMIHDIDLALALAASDPVTVEGEGIAVHGDLADEARAEATFDSGMVAVFEASRTAEARERRMRLIYPSGEVEIDFLARTFRNTTPFRLDEGFAESAIGRDPLGAALTAFVARVRGEADAMPAAASDGARALDLALAVEHAAGF